MKKAERIAVLLDLLDKEYGPAHCYLNYETPWQLLIATMLSAQCTDDRVNMVTKELFQKYKSVADFAMADQHELELDIHSTGFFRNKAANIIACCQMLIEKYDGQVPSDIDCLTALPGVGRKTANVVRGHIFELPSVVVDTHVKRVAGKLGLTKHTDPVKIEFDLMKCIPKDHWISLNTQLIAHGRKVCIARRPQCQACILAEYCTGKEKN